MATAEQLKALLKSHADGDDDRFLSIAMQVAAHAARQGHARLAQELKSLIDEAKERQGAPTARRGPGGLTPLAQPRGELAGLITAAYPETSLADMVLDDSTKARLQRVLKEHRQLAKLQEHGMRPRSRLLLIGPPGSGKTMTASALAGEMRLPLFTIVLDGLITRYMGETAAKLRLVFDAIRSVRGVYLFDEFDAIGGRREATNDVGEIRRVLNSFLQFLEQDESNSLILAATNHPELLDRALFRRFDDVISYDVPSGDLVVRALKSRLGSFATRRIDWRKLGEAARGLSYAELTRAANDAVKEAVLDDRSEITTAALLAAFAERKVTRQG